MTSHRPYRRAVPADEAVAELLCHSGTQFDARIAHAARSDDRALSASAKLSFARFHPRPPPTSRAVRQPLAGHAR
jgi:hypothetical protein